MQLPVGFQFAGITCGIKKSGRPDLALLVAEPDSVAVGVYTQNQVVAAPVLVCRSRTPGNVRAVIINSGNANACTGQPGMENALRMTEMVATALGCHSDQVLVMSTGVIGHPLPMDRITQGVTMAVDQLATGESAFFAAADAILTTDQGRKTATRVVELAGGRSAVIAGMAKGAGMIGPNMATMLGVLLTDFPLTPLDAQHALAEAARHSFNCISVEGHTSTNDSLVLLSSNQSSGGAVTNREDREGFQSALTDLCIELAKQIPADGEGATHLIEIRVHGAVSDSSAATIGKTIAESALVKTAITGGDPNWGRIVSAAGYAGEPIEPSRMALEIQGIAVYAAGAPVPFDARLASEAIKSTFNVRMDLTVGDGPGKSTFWTSDLTVAYVRFNSEYTT